MSLSQHRKYVQTYISSIARRPVLLFEESESTSKSFFRSSECRVVLPPEANPDRPKDISELEYYISLASIQAGIYRYNNFDREAPAIPENIYDVTRVVEFARVVSKLRSEYSRLGETIQNCFKEKLVDPYDVVVNQVDFGYIFSIIRGLFGIAEPKELKKRLLSLNRDHVVDPEQWVTLLSSPNSSIRDSIMLAEDLENHFNEGKKEMYKHLIDSQGEGVRSRFFNPTAARIDLIWNDSFVIYSNLNNLQLHIPRIQPNTQYVSECTPAGKMISFTRVHHQSPRDNISGKFDRTSQQQKRIEHTLQNKLNEYHALDEKMRKKFYYFIEEDHKNRRKLEREVTRLQRQLETFSLVETDESPASSINYDEHTANSVRRSMELIKPSKRSIVRRCSNGKLDMRAYTKFKFANLHGVSEDPNFFYQVRKNIRDVASLILIDASASVKEKHNDKSLWELIAEQVLYFGHAMHALEDPFAIYAYNGFSQKNVNMYELKRFDQDFNPLSVIVDMSKIVPQQNNRDGAAIRSASDFLMRTNSKMKLLYHISDMRPADVTVDESTDSELMDQKYVGEYALNDCVEALNHARSQGILPVGICVRPYKKKIITARSSRMRSKLKLQKVPVVSKTPTEILTPFRDQYLVLDDLSHNHIFNALQRFYSSLTL